MSNDLALATLGELFRGPLTQAIGWGLVHLLWQGALVAGILAASLGLMRCQSANARYLVCCAALGMVVILGAATSIHGYEPALSAPSGAFTTSAVSTPAVTDSSTGVGTSLDTSAGQTLVRFAARHLPVIVLVWMIGVLLLSTRLLWGWISVHRMAARGATPASDHWQSIAIRLSGALRLHRAIQLFESAAVEVPTVIGWLRPAILLPAASLSGLSLEQMEMVLAHELAHVRRNDFFVNLLQAVIETLLFYHPAVWWISSRIRVEREHCCDDIAVSVSGTPLLYARALTRLEELRVPPTQSVLAANGGSLLTRIRRLAGGRSEALNGPSRWVAGAALLMIVTALLIAPSFPLGARTSETQQPPALAAPRSTPASAKVEVRASNPTNENSDADDDASPADDPNNQDDDQESAVRRFDFNFQFATPPVPPAAPAAPAAPSSSAPPAPPTPAVPPATQWRGSPLAPPAVPSLPAPPAPPAPLLTLHPMAPNSRHLFMVPELGALTAVAPAIALGAVEGAMLGMDARTTPEIRTRVAEALATLHDHEHPMRMLAPRARARERHRKIGSTGKLTVDDLITLRAAGVTPGYIEEMRKAGLGDVSLDDIATMHIHGVTPAYVAALRKSGMTIDSPESLLGMRIHGVSAEFIAGMRDAGYPNLSSRELMELRVMGVTPEFVRQMSDAGYRNLAARDLIQLRATGVTPSFVKALAAAGYSNLSVRDLTRMAATGVNADFIRELSKYRTR